MLRIDFVLTSLALGVLASLAGAWFPARPASQLDPMLALHNSEARRQETVLGWGRTVLGAALGAIFLIVAGEFLRPAGELATFIVSAAALLVILFFPNGFLGSVLSRGTRL